MNISEGALARLDIKPNAVDHGICAFQAASDCGGVADVDATMADRGIAAANRRGFL
jgi:hypothetical protein